MTKRKRIFVFVGMAVLFFMVFSSLQTSPIAANSPLAVAATADTPAPCALGAATDTGMPSFPGCPEDMKALFSRAVECVHFSGEEPYDAERAKFLSEAVARLRCDALPADHVTLLKTHINNQAVLEVFSAAAAQHELYDVLK